MNSDEVSVEFKTNQYLATYIIDVSDEMDLSKYGNAIEYMCENIDSLNPVDKNRYFKTYDFINDNPSDAKDSSIRRLIMINKKERKMLFCAFKITMKEYDLMFINKHYIDNLSISSNVDDDDDDIIKNTPCFYTVSTHNKYISTFTILLSDKVDLSEYDDDISLWRITDFDSLSILDKSHISATIEYADKFLKSITVKQSIRRDIYVNKKTREIIICIFKIDIHQYDIYYINGYYSSHDQLNTLTKPTLDEEFESIISKNTYTAKDIIQLKRLQRERNDQRDNIIQRIQVCKNLPITNINTTINEYKIHKLRKRKSKQLKKFTQTLTDLQKKIEIENDQITAIQKGLDSKS